MVALAPHGAIGTWLLDPIDVIVATGGGATLVNVAAFATATCNPTCTIAPATINGAGANVTIQAQQDITVTNAIAMTGAGITLTMDAGRSILVNAGISTTNAAITLVANDTAASGGTNRGGLGVNGNTAGGAAALTIAGGVTISSGTGAISLTNANTVAAANGDVTLSSTAALTTVGGGVTISAADNVTGAAGVATTCSVAPSPPPALTTRRRPPRAD